jgi:hypothetical protein
MNLPIEFKQNVVTALLEARKNFDGSDNVFANQYKINNSVFSRLKNGQMDGLLKDAQWLTIGRMLDVSLSKRKWNVARTEVFSLIEEEIVFCKEYSKAKILVDECGIGKTFTAKYLSRTLKNCFYVDASQAKTKRAFIRLIARTLGVDDNGHYTEILANVKYYLHVLPQPIIVIDEAGDLDYPSFLAIKELWNATENVCGWYMMGADGLKAKIERGISNRKVGFREVFSRFSDRFSDIVPAERIEKLNFYKKLIIDVLTANCNDKDIINTIVKKCLVQQNGTIGGLRRAESLLILSK